VTERLRWPVAYKASQKLMLGQEKMPAKWTPLHHGDT